MTRPYLGNPKYTIEVLQKYNFAFQKRFGQNFLIDTHVLEKIIEASKITKDDFVLEIGPGIGTMGVSLSRWLPICLIILPRQSSWDFLKTMFPFLPSPLWYRRKWQTECRLVLEQRITVLCPWLFSIMPDRRSLRMFRRTVLCQDRRWEVLLSSL